MNYFEFYHQQNQSSINIAEGEAKLPTWREMMNTEKKMIAERNVKAKLERIKALKKMMDTEELDTSVDDSIDDFEF
tara:strand:+ start:207 stop:434 length:228 start_codon:yes stop_codon:yes gene_type:complete